MLCIYTSLGPVGCFVAHMKEDDETLEQSVSQNLRRGWLSLDWGGASQVGLGSRVGLGRVGLR